MPSATTTTTKLSPSAATAKKILKSKLRSTPKSVSDFAILPLTLPSLPGIPKQYANAQHYLYIKPHEPSHPTPEDEKSLFLSNVPIDANEENIKTLFAEQLGGARIVKVEFDSAVPAAPVLKKLKESAVAVQKEEVAGAGRKGKKRKRDDEDIVAEGVVEDEESRLPNVWPGEVRKGGACAVVVFVDKRSFKGAWGEVKKIVGDGREVAWRGGEGVLGVNRYRTHLNLTYPNPTDLQSSIDAYLTQFNHAESARDRLRKKQRSVPDEEGFITVTRGGRSGPARIEEAQRKKLELEERKKKAGAGGSFYRFQNRERRKEAEVELRRKFEEDRRRVEEMRARRGKKVGVQS